MTYPWLGVIVVLGVLGVMFGSLKLIERLVRPHPELLRKLMHVGTGLVVLIFPWVFNRAWPVLLLAGLSATLLTTVKLVPHLRSGIGSVLTGVGRPSLGELCFPASVALLFVLSRGDWLLYVVPMLIITLADAVAALVGISYGKLRYVTSDGLKSVEGSIAFFAIAFLSVHVPLLLFTDVGRPQTLLISTIIGILAMLLEAIAWRGMDNLLIPLGAFAFLRLYLNAEVEPLVLRVVATVALLIFALVWRRRSSLDDSALMACALYGYAAWMLAGPVWLIGPVALFLLHVAVWPRDGGSGYRPEHTVYTVASVVAAGLVWIAMHVAYDAGALFLRPYAAAFGTHLAIIGISHAATGPAALPWRRLALPVAAGWLLYVFQTIPVLLHDRTARVPRLLIFVGSAIAIAIAAGGFNLMLPRLYGPSGSNSQIHTAGGAVALVASTVVAALVLVVSAQ